MRFSGQPATKEVLLNRFGTSLGRVLMRSANIPDPNMLPPDLRPLEDYTFHGNRSVLLWTWLKGPKDPSDAWADDNTRPLLMNHQARAEHIEYYNMRIARATSIAHQGAAEETLRYAYASLAKTENDLQSSSQAGEVTESLKALIKEFGTLDKVPAAKESARWHLDDLRLQAERRRGRTDRVLTVVFGLVGAAALADLITKPLIHAWKPGLETWILGVTSFLAASLAVAIALAASFMANRDK
jgi:hypothetical protein